MSFGKALDEILIMQVDELLSSKTIILTDVTSMVSHNNCLKEAICGFELNLLVNIKAELVGRGSSSPTDQASA